jgi:acetyl esterase/lipase
MNQVLLAVLTLALQTPQMQVHQDVSYYDGADRDPQKHSLDLYLPGGAKDYPLIVFVHGGAWSRGDKALYARAATGLLESNFVSEGIGVAIMNYRLSPQVKHPEHARDVARAVAWAHRNSKTHGWDARKILLMGHSAGAHLASLVAVDPRFLEEQDLKTNVIRGVIAISGIYDLTRTGVVGQFIYEPVFGLAPEDLKDASPALRINSRPPPFLLLHAENDYPTADYQARWFKRALEAARGEATARMVPGQGHVDILTSLVVSGGVVLSEVNNFLNRVVSRN